MIEFSIVSEYARTWLKTMDLIRQGKLTDAHAKLTEAGLKTGVWLAILPSKDTARQMLQTSCCSSVKNKGYQSDRRIAGPTQQYVLPCAQLQKSYI